MEPDNVWCFCMKTTLVIYCTTVPIETNGNMLKPYNNTVCLFKKKKKSVTYLKNYKEKQQTSHSWHWNKSDEDVAACLESCSAQHHPDITGTAGENPLQCNMILLADTSKQKFGSFHAKGKISPWTICWGLKLTWRHSQQDLHQKLQRNSRSASPSSQPWRPHRSCSRLECESQNCFSAADLLFAK